MPTPRSNAMQVLRALETASEASASEGWHGFTFEERDWSARGEFNRLSCRSLFDPKTIHLLSSVRHRLEHTVQLARALAASASDVLLLFERHLEPVVAKLSKGMASLPNELLTLIFRLAADHEQQRTRHAIWLSHVSRRFRAIALGDRCLWTTQLRWCNSSEQIVEECISRCGNDADLQIVLNRSNALSYPSMLNFVRTCLPFDDRWQSLTLECSWDDHEDGTGANQGYRVEYLLEALMQNYSITAPRLRELHLVQRHYHGTKENLVWTPSFETVSPLTLRPWITPNLRTVRCTQYIPSESLPLTSITRFELSISLLPGVIIPQVEELLFFLTSAESMSELDLDLNIRDNADMELRGELEMRGPFLCAQLTSFKLHVSGLSLPNGIFWLLQPFLGELQMPLLEHLSLSITLGLLDILYHGSTTHDIGLLSGLIYYLIPDPRTCIRLTSLAVAVNLNALAPGIEGVNMFLTIPLDRVPHVTTLAVSTFCRVEFSRQDDPRPKQRYLRELQLCSCLNLGAGNLLATIRSLKDVDAWGVLDRVVIQDCTLLDYDTALITIGKERLCFSS